MKSEPLIPQLPRTSFTNDELSMADKLAGQIEPDFRCSMCLRIMWTVCQADPCGCRYCAECLDQAISQGVCQQCKEKVTSNKIPDMNMRRKIRSKPVNCQARDCNWSGSLEEMFRSHYKTHEMGDQILKCEFCSREFSSKAEIEKHLDKDDGDCNKQPIDCPYKHIGCNRIESSGAEAKPTNSANESMDTGPMSLTRETIEPHIRDNNSYHLLLVRNRVLALEKELREGSIHHGEKLNQGASTSAGIDEPKFPASVGDISSLQDTNSRIDMLHQTHKQLLGDVERLQKVIENYKLENRVLKDNLKEIKQLTLDLHRTLAINQVSILALEERLLNQEKISYDGLFLWRISNVSERIQEAKSGRQTSFYSPPFYTGRNGYKMCVRVYLNGDGNGRNTHLSLFFVIMRGEFDALLRWPFRQKVTFVLIDQTTSESKENVYDAFRPDPNSSSFKRPTSDMNIASGLPVFCPLSKLTASSDHEYIKDNTMFIKTIVDVTDLPPI